MKYLFVDTAGWMACADEADPAHAFLRKQIQLATHDVVPRASR